MDSVSPNGGVNGTASNDGRWLHTNPKGGSLANFDEARRESISPVTTEPGWISRQEIIERYAEETRRDLSGIAFYEVFALFKVAVVLQQIYFRYARGQTHDERFKEFDKRVSGLARAAWDLAERSGI